MNSNHANGKDMFYIKWKLGLKINLKINSRVNFSNNPQLKKLSRLQID